MILLSHALNRAGHTFLEAINSNLISLMLDGSHTFQGGLVSVTQVGDTYTATIPAGNANTTTWWESVEGRTDFLNFTGDFDVEARNIGITSGAVPGQFQFGGLMVRQSPLNYEFNVAGNRGGVVSTVEYKATEAGVSTQNDVTANAITNHRCDIRVTRIGSTVTWYYKEVGANTWITTPMGNLNFRTDIGTGAVQVGLITYAYGTVGEFFTACDSVIVNSGSYT
jgi:hypothetical protein